MNTKNWGGVVGHTLFDKKESIEVVFNGILYLARDVKYSTMYLGSGKTSGDALADIHKTLSKIRGEI